ncbi:rod shape-determining protein RodA [Orrella sp. 11846]|uniref:rod shape-determining protein RodA n=1 Tax=Orrella sp. 11846 TaxID=3409913 RepID=UPI003B5B77B6
MIRLFNAVMQVFRSIDWPVMLLLALLSVVGLLVMHSAVGGTDWRYADQSRYMVYALIVMWIVALIPSQFLARLAPLAYLITLALLVAVALFGESSKGAARWLDIGILRLQPSEIMKITLPMMLAWYFQRREGKVGWYDFMVAMVMTLIPFALIALQPDLGTALLVVASGFFVMYFAGLSFKLLIPLVLAATIGLSVIYINQDVLCEPETDWIVLHSYQKSRVCTLLDPTRDPLGRGFHTIQSTIAVGSGGLLGRGYMSGTQGQLSFIPERTTDFIFAVFAEEFGLFGALSLLFLYLLLIMRGLFIASRATTTYGRLLAGSISMTVFIYVFVNTGMVIGLLPVVGVPLPLFSYGGSALLSLAVAFGLLMGISAKRKQQQKAVKTAVRP